MAKQSKTTIIEVGIILVILTILALLIVPTYFTYKNRQNYAQIIAEVRKYRTAVDKCYAKTHRLGRCSAGRYGIPRNLKNATSKKIKLLTVKKGTIHVMPVTFKGINEKDTYTLIPTVTKGRITWIAGGESVKKGYAN